ncbi:MAG: signal peptide peptidase SppA [Bacteriovoracaceae bacterium]|nr:signal peptide peptidase SppA [Bacteriovoracaceae bacterium]
MSSDKSKTVVGIFLLIFVLFVIFMVFAFYTVANLKSAGDQSENTLFNESKAPIAVLSLEGVIMDSNKVIERLLKLEEDKTVKAIILRIDSPGGAVGPTQEIYEEVLRIDEKKPIYASFGTVAASGGYYVGAATRKIYANAGTLTGSIGVIMQFMDMSKLYEFAKVNPQTVKAGKYKDVGSPFRGMNNEEKQLLDTMIDGVHQQFMDDIQRKRKGKIKGKLIDLAQGQIFSGVEAKKFGLVDEIGGLWAAGRAIHKELNIKEEFDLRFIRKKKRMNFLEILDEAAESVSYIKNMIFSTSKPLLMLNM